MFQILTDSCCDLGVQGCNALGVQMIPFYVSYDNGATYQKEEQELPVRDLYEIMVSQPDNYPQTSLPSIDDYASLFTHYAQQGTPVLCICFTSRMSGSYNAACNARMLVLEDIPGADITVLDSRCATVTQALLVQQAVKLRDQGCSVAKAAQILEKTSASARIFFTVDNMDYLAHGGRIGKAAGHAVNRLGLKPMIIHVEGEVDFGGLVRGRAASMQKAINMTLNYIKAAPAEYEFLVGYGYSAEEGDQLRRMLQTALWEKCKVIREVKMIQIGATIAVHTGPYALGIGVLAK